MPKMTKLQLKRSSAASKAWETRRKQQAPSRLATQMRPSAASTSTRTTSTTPTGQNFVQGLRKRPSVTAKTVVEKVQNAARMEYYTGTDRSVLVLYTK